MSKPTTVVTLRHRLGTTGGFTVPVVPGSISQFGDFVTEGFALSLNPECEQHFPATMGSVNLLSMLLDYVHRNRVSLLDPNKYFGAWLDRESDTIYLDVVTVLDDKAKALELAELHNQLAIFDLGAGEEIRTGVVR